MLLGSSLGSALQDLQTPYKPGRIGKQLKQKKIQSSSCLPSKRSLKTSRTQSIPLPQCTSKLHFFFLIKQGEKEGLPAHAKKVQINVHRTCQSSVLARWHCVMSQDSCWSSNWCAHVLCPCTVATTRSCFPGILFFVKHMQWKQRNGECGNCAIQRSQI